MTTEDGPDIVARQRIDKWLFFTRVAKSRSLAQTLISSGRVKVNGSRIAQPSVNVKPGDTVEVTLDRRDLVLKVVSGGSRRGPYQEARLLYEDHSPPPPPKNELTPFEIATRAAGSGRPEKKDRRALNRLLGRG
ncbi:RNA-binding S4 domain-containing protein [Rhizobium sp. L1K21]|uniref:RNA-binding S4 domain-containing protein n=1 Tax=Rhizobium sp. L1K21 TaxID=2954933 RepID=UPI002092B469|nr:RNA-binding S4 domain-containing protein [Rhizobium sp. L1K21]MCO6188066.1 RNA-binding S4 domain-containing protein [Rhizobium sp. L1K21]